MSLADLTALIKPPAVPKQVGTPTAWRAVERHLGITFPTDYRDYVLTYGAGQIGEFYWVWNPFGGSVYLEQVQRVCGYERQAWEHFPQYNPYPIYPSCPGFLPWGSDDNGNYYGWLTDGVPDCWRVLTNNVRGHGFRLHDCTMTEYLVGVFRATTSPLASNYPDPASLLFEQPSGDLRPGPLDGPAQPTLPGFDGF